MRKQTQHESLNSTEQQSKRLPPNKISFEYIAQNLLLRPLLNSVYVQKLTAERTEHLQCQLQVKDEFIKAWVHDIGGLIHGMNAALDLVKDDLNVKDILYVLGVLNTGCQIMADIHNNIGEFLNGYDEVYPENIELAKWLPPIIDLYRPLATTKNIQIGLNINHVNDFTFSTDKLKLVRVVSNLLDNAIKYTPVGKAITVITYCKANLLYIEIQDKGIGIPGDKLHTVFLPYVQLDKKRPGMGIGLANCKKIMDQLQGKITVTSKLSEGSTFTITVPL